MKDQRRLRVMTFNVHGGRPAVGAVDLKAVAAVIREVGPDLAGLQELHRWMPPPYVFQDQPHRLRKLLDMEVYFRRSFGLGPSGFGNALLSWRKLELVHRRRLPGGGWRQIEPRVLLEGRGRHGKQRIRVLNTHLGLSHSERLRQVRRIAERIRRYTEPVVLMGDFNATPDSPEIELLKAAGLHDCASPNVLTFPCGEPKCRLDHILVSAQFEVIRCFAVETDVSDHLPVVADLALRG
ncbi:MAG: endonuclease/exonuclease/phosphatase family protein [Actinomycetota bacterium]